MSSDVLNRIIGRVWAMIPRVSAHPFVIALLGVTVGYLGASYQVRWQVQRTHADFLGRVRVIREATRQVEHFCRSVRPMEGAIEVMGDEYSRKLSTLTQVWRRLESASRTVEPLLDPLASQDPYAFRLASVSLGRGHEPLDLDSLLADDSAVRTRLRVVSAFPRESVGAIERRHGSVWSPHVDSSVISTNASEPPLAVPRLWRNVETRCADLVLLASHLDSVGYHGVDSLQAPR